MNDSELIERLKSASDGLLWLSESDYPFETVYWENVNDIRSLVYQPFQLRLSLFSLTFKPERGHKIGTVLRVRFCFGNSSQL